MPAGLERRKLRSSGRAGWIIPTHSVSAAGEQARPPTPFFVLQANAKRMVGRLVAKGLAQGLALRHWEVGAVDGSQKFAGLANAIRLWPIIGREKTGHHGKKDWICWGASEDLLGGWLIC
jgi:hypothetical protein